MKKIEKTEKIEKAEKMKKTEEEIDKRVYEIRPE